MGNRQQPQRIDISEEQILDAAAAGVQFLNLKTTLIPGDLKKQLAVLEVVLQGIGLGGLVVASPDQLAVKSKPTGSPAVKDGIRKASAAGASRAKSHRKGTGKK